MNSYKGGVKLNIVMGIIGLLLGIWFRSLDVTDLSNNMGLMLIIISLTVSPFGAYRWWKKGQTQLNDDDDDEILVLPDDKYEKAAAVESSSEVNTIVKCESCGAKNIVNAGIKGKCEYCGSPIK